MRSHQSWHQMEHECSTRLTGNSEKSFEKQGKSHSPQHEESCTTRMLPHHPSILQILWGFPIRLARPPWASSVSNWQWVVSVSVEDPQTNDIRFISNLMNCVHSRSRLSACAWKLTRLLVSKYVFYVFTISEMNWYHYTAPVDVSITLGPHSIAHNLT